MKELSNDFIEYMKFKVRSFKNIMVSKNITSDGLSIIGVLFMLFSLKIASQMMFIAGAVVYLLSFILRDYIKGEWKHQLREERKIKYREESKNADKSNQDNEQE